MSTQDATPEMGKYLRQIVDNYLEEGQFESGVAMLDQMRSPNHKPSIIHILHLIYISLHSSEHGTRLDGPGTDPLHDPTLLLQQSPRKIIKQSKSALVLSPETIAASRRLLYALISTNSPADIAAALPNYPLTEIRRQNIAEGEGGAHFGFEFLDSPIYNQAVAIKNARSVWEILKDGYTTRSMQIFGTPKARSKGRSLKARALGRESSFNMSMEIEKVEVVGQDSWFFLEWLVALFEKDAEQAQAQGLGKHSQLLLRQLPPPSINTTTRWVVSEPLEVVAYALKQADSRKRRVGLRLLNLLIDLSHTPYLNLSSLTSSTLAQISSYALHSNTSSGSPLGSPGSPPPQGSNTNPLMTLFDSLNASLPSLSFTIMLCKKILQGNIDAMAAVLPISNGQPSASINGLNDSGHGQFGPATNPPPLVSALKRPEPRPRVAPRPRGVAASKNETQPTAPPTASTNTSSGQLSASLPLSSEEAIGPESVAPLISPPVSRAFPPKPHLPQFDDTAILVKTQTQDDTPASGPIRTRARQRNRNVQNEPQTPWSTPSLRLRVKFELLHACTTLAKLMCADLLSNGPEHSTKAVALDWTQAASDGRLDELLFVVFGPEGYSSTNEEVLDKQFYMDVIKANVG